MKLKKQKLDQRGSLEKVLDFLDIAHKADDIQSEHCVMEMGQAQSYNRVIGAGITFDEDLSACPHVRLLRAAITRCTERFSITQLSALKLLVRSGDFHAYVPCLEPTSVVCCLPDAPVGPLNDRFMEALGKVAVLAVTKAESVLECCIQLNNGSVIATNRHVIIEAWHGSEFPNGLLLPKVAFAALKKAKKRIVQFGFSPETVTFYFEDKSWILSRLFQATIPSGSQLLSVPTKERDIPIQFFPAIEKVLPFSSNGLIHVEGNLISSHASATHEEGSGLALTFEGKGHEARIYSGNDLLTIAKYVVTWDECARPDGTIFYGKDLRGIISHTQKNQVNNYGGSGPIEDEDIPF